MSTIGPGSIGSLNLAGSLAGAQTNRTDTKDAKARAAERTLQIDQEAMSSRDLDDVAETDRSADRDADGRRPYEASGRGPSEEPPRSPRAVDTEGELGASLDLDA